MGRAGGSYTTDDKTGEKVRQEVAPPKPDKRNAKTKTTPASDAATTED